MRIRKIIPPKVILHQRLAVLFGHSQAPKRPYFENVETKDVYTRLMGGIAWPSPTGNRPGYAIVLAAGRVERIDDLPTISALDETTDDDPARLIERCLKSREIWGFSLSDDLHLWLGDSQRYLPIWTDINSRLIRQYSDTAGFIVGDPDGFETPNRFERYLQALRRVVTPNDEGKTILQLGQCDILRLALKNAPPDVARRPADDFPVLFGAGGLVYSLMSRKPWLEGVKKERVHSTIPWDTEQRAFFDGEDDPDQDPYSW